MNRIIFSFFFFFFYSFCIMVTAYPSACSNNFHFSCFQYLGLWGPPKYEAPWASPQGGDLPSGLSVSLSLYIFFSCFWTPDFSSCSWFYSAPAIGQKYLISDWSEYPISDWSIILLWVIIFLHNIVVIGQKYLISDWCKFTKSDVWLVSISDFWFVNNCF